jgi:hypothetical protein
MTLRSGKRKEMAKMVMAFAKQKWDHKMFHATEEVETGNKSAKEQKALPMYLMMAKYGGKEIYTGIASRESGGGGEP